MRGSCLTSVSTGRPTVRLCVVPTNRSTVHSNTSIWFSILTTEHERLSLYQAFRRVRHGDSVTKPDYYAYYYYHYRYYYRYYFRPSVYDRTTVRPCMRRPSVCPSVCLSVRSCIHACMRPSLLPSVRMSSVRLFGRLFTCMSSEQLLESMRYHPAIRVIGSFLPTR